MKILKIKMNDAKEFVATASCNNSTRTEMRGGNLKKLKKDIIDWLKGNLFLGNEGWYSISEDGELLEEHYVRLSKEGKFSVR